MTSVVVNVSEIDVSCEPVEFVCYGLGSCIGLFISDSSKMITGAAHIPLPSNSKTGAKLQGASHMIDHLLMRFKAHGIPPAKLVAKVAGGAKIIVGTQQIGEKNIQSVLGKLNDLGVTVAATDLGGDMSRTARYNSVTGDLFIIKELKKYSI